MKKRLLSLALVLVLALSLLPGAALAAPPGSYDVNGTTISVTKLGINVSGRLTYIGDGVFRSSNESSSGITYISSLKDIKYYFYDFDGNLTWQYDGSMEVGDKFSDGLCKMLMFDPYTGVEKWGYIDKYGNTVIDGQFDAAEDFSDGLAAVKKDGLWGYVNTSGKLVIPCEYLYVHDFGDGLAFVRTGDYKEYCIDKSGNIVFEVPKEPVQDMFGTIMTYGYSCIHPHRDGYAMMSNTTGKYEGVVLMDKKGNVTEIPGVDYTTGTWNTSARFDSGRLPVRAGGHAGVADMDGNLIVPFIYDRIYSYSNGVAPARNDEGLWGLLDVNGNVAVPFEWSFMWEFDGNQLVAQHKSDYRFYLLEVGGTAQPAEPEPEPEPETPPASDEPSGWAAEDVQRAVESGIVPENLQSAYTQATTRAEFCALAVGLYESVMGEEITERATFTDTDDINVQKMAGLGVVNGMGEGKFEPDSALTREQAATLLSRLAAAMDKPFESSDPTFADNGSVSDWASAAVGEMQKSGVMGGVGEGMFDPKGSYTREQSIITMLRTLDIVG